MSTVPVTEVVRINPAALAAGGSQVALTAMLLTTSTRVPIGTTARFSGNDLVGDYFGDDSIEARAGARYFPGFDGALTTPGTIGYVQYNEVDVGAYLRGGDISDMSLTTLQGISGTLSIVLDGVTKSSSPNLSGATSKSNAAQLLAASLAIKGPQSATLTGVIAGTTLTASGVTGVISAGSPILGSGVASGTYAIAQLTGTPGGAGTYQVNNSQTVGSEAMTADAPAITYDSVSGAFVVISPSTGVNSTAAFATGTIADDLKLTSATGAVLSQGAAAVTTPAAFMTNLLQITKAFATFELLFNPDNSGNDLRFAFAQWNGGQKNRFVYVAIDDDAAPTVTVPSVDCLAQRIIAAGISGTIVNWQPVQADPLDYANLTSFVCSIPASLDFTALNGRTTFAFRSQSGLVPGVTDQQTYDNLVANGYNVYAVFAEGFDQEDSTGVNIWEWYGPGSITGAFVWSDTYVNQIALNGEFTIDLVDLLRNASFIPYNAAGRTQIETSLADTIQQFLDFGAYSSGIVLSGSQRTSVNGRAGKNIADTLTNQGWYLDVGIAAPDVRQARGSPPMTFYYTDGESVQQFDMASIVLQ